MRGKGERQAEHRRKARAEEARAEQPHRHLDAGAGHGTHRLPRLRRLEIPEQLQHVVGERLGTVEIAAQRARRRLVGAWRATEAEVDPARVQRGQRAELFGDLQRRVVGQHHAAGADADAARAARHVPDQHGGGGAGDARHVVVLGQPIAAIAELFGMPRKVQRVAEGLRDVAALAHRCEVEDGKGNHGRAPCP